MAIFMGLWSCLYTTKLKSVIHHNLGHSRGVLVLLYTVSGRTWADLIHVNENSGKEVFVGFMILHGTVSVFSLLGSTFLQFSGCYNVHFYIISYLKIKNENVRQRYNDTKKKTIIFYR